MPPAPLVVMALCLLAAYGAGGPLELAVVESLRVLAPLARILDWPGDGTPWVVGATYAALWGVATRRPHWVGAALFTVAAVLLWRYAASASPRAARSTSAMAFARP